MASDENVLHSAGAATDMPSKTQVSLATSDLADLVTWHVWLIHIKIQQLRSLFDFCFGFQRFSVQQGRSPPNDQPHMPINTGFAKWFFSLLSHQDLAQCLARRRPSTNTDGLNERIYEWFHGERKGNLQIFLCGGLLHTKDPLSVRWSQQTPPPNSVF